VTDGVTVTGIEGLGVKYAVREVVTVTVDVLVIRAVFELVRLGVLVSVFVIVLDGVFVALAVIDSVAVTLVEAVQEGVFVFEGVFV